MNNNYADSDFDSLILGQAQNIFDYGFEQLQVSEVSDSIFERGTEEELRALQAGSPEFLAATFVASRCRRAAQTQRGNADLEPNVHAELLIEEFAKRNNFWLDDTDRVLSEKYGSKYAFGSEASVYLDSVSRIVIKAIDYDGYGSVEKSLHRVLIHNLLFPATPLNVIGFGRSHFGLFEIVAEQPFIRGRYALQSEIDMSLSDYNCVDGSFETSRYYVSDLLPKNAIYSNGCIFIIDAYLSFKKGIFDDF